MAIIEKTHWRVVGPLLDDLLDADSSERVARLAEIQRTDSGLAIELEVLLAREAAIAGTALKRRIRNVARPPSARHRPWPADLATIIR